MSTVIRYLLTTSLLALVWLDVRWALYLAVTLCAVAVEVLVWSERRRL